MKKALIFTSNRSEWGLLKLLVIRMREVYDLKIIACASHINPIYSTIEDIKKDFNCEIVENTISSNTDVGCCKSSGVLLITLAEKLKQINPEFIVLLGDRYETLCAAYTCNILGIRIVHLHGGEKSGNTDNIFRDCITRMSYVHCAATSTSYVNLRNMINNSYRKYIYLTGALGCEGLESIKKSNEDKIILIIYHPNTIDRNENIDEILEAVKYFLHKMYNLFVNNEIDFKCNIKIILPNNDFGNKKIINKIRNWTTKTIHQVECISHLSRDKFLQELKNSSVILGNSSAGIIEAPCLKVPTINYGSRQINREKASSVFNANCSSSIINLLFKIFDEKDFVKYNYKPYLGTDQNGIPASQSILNVLIEVFGK